MKDDLKKIMQPKTIKSKNNGYGTAPGNLVFYIILQFMQTSTHLTSLITGQLWRICTPKISNLVPTL